MAKIEIFRPKFQVNYCNTDNLSDRGVHKHNETHFLSKKTERSNYGEALGNPLNN